MILQRQNWEKYDTHNSTNDVCNIVNILFFILLVIFIVFSSPAKTDTVYEAATRTLEGNPALKAAAANVAVIEAQRKAAIAERRPTINGQIGYDYGGSSFDFGDELDFGALLGPQGGAQIIDELGDTGASGAFSAGLEVMQPLYRGGRLKNGIGEAQSALLAMEAEYSRIRQAVLFDVIRIYSMVLTARERRDIAANSVSVLSERKRSVEARFDVGQVTKTDIAQAEARLVGAQAQLIAFDFELVQAQAQYQRLVGDAPADLAPVPAVPGLPGALEEMIALARKHSPLLRAGQARAEAARYALKKAKGFLAPSLSAVATLGYQENTFIEGDEAQQAAIGANLTIPIFQGGRTLAAIKQARAAHTAQRYNLHEVERQIDEQARIAWQQLQAARAALRAAEAQLAANELAFEGVELEAALGQRTPLEVLNAEQELLLSRLDAVEARQNVQLSGYNILQAIGILMVESIRENVSDSD